MIASMFNLDHRLAELRPTEQELRQARELRKAAAPASRPPRSAGEPTGGWVRSTLLGSQPSRPAAV